MKSKLIARLGFGDRSRNAAKQQQPRTIQRSRRKQSRHCVHYPIKTLSAYGREAIARSAPLVRADCPASLRLDDATSLLQHHDLNIFRISPFIVTLPLPTLLELFHLVSSQYEVSSDNSTLLKNGRYELQITVSPHLIFASSPIFLFTKAIVQFSVFIYTLSACQPWALLRPLGTIAYRRSLY